MATWIRAKGEREREREKEILDCTVVMLVDGGIWRKRKVVARARHHEPEIRLEKMWSVTLRQRKHC